jgi:four helix bundle protein
MATSFEELRVLREAEAVADGVWQEVLGWEPFAREVVGGQLARAADSIGANIAEAFGRFHYGEKLQYSLFTEAELKWLQAAEIPNL